MRSMDVICRDLKTAIKKIDKLFRRLKVTAAELCDGSATHMSSLGM